MDDTAERGVAAHWDYKESSDQASKQVERKARQRLSVGRELVSLLELNDEATEFLENTKLEMYQDKFLFHAQR